MSRPPRKDKRRTELDDRGRQLVRDRFYSSMKLTSAPRNVAGYSLARSGNLPNLDPRRQEFMLEGAIDPANIRARHDPLHALPNSYQQGAIGFGYQLGDKQLEARNQVDLIRKARASYGARMNRLQPSAVPVREQAPERFGIPT